MKHKFYLLAVFFTAGIVNIQVCRAADTRVISSWENRNFSSSGYSDVFNNTLIIPVKRNSLLIRHYRDIRKEWNNTIVFGGPVIVWNPNHYSEFTFGYGSDSEEDKATFYYGDITREKKDYLSGLAYKHGNYEDQYYNMLSFYLKYNLSNNFSLLGKTFLSMDHKDNIDNSFWGEAEYDIEKFSFKAGGTAGDRLYDNDPDVFSTGGFYSLLFGAGADITDYIAVNYQYEEIVRKDSYTTYKNVITCDIRF